MDLNLILLTKKNRLINNYYYSQHIYTTLGSALGYTSGSYSVCMHVCGFFLQFLVQV